MGAYDDLIPGATKTATPAANSGGGGDLYNDLIPGGNASPTSTGGAYFSSYGPTGNFAPSAETDVSGRPFLDYRGPNDTATTTDRTRVDTTFDPREASMVGKFVTPRMSQNDSTKIKSSMGGTSGEELDHTTPLELAGSNDRSNLRLENLTPGSKNTPTDSLENKLADDVAHGRLSLFDAQVQMAKVKGSKVPFTGAPAPLFPGLGGPMPKEGFVKGLVGSTIQGFKDAEAAGAPKSFKNVFQTTDNPNSFLETGARHIATTINDSADRLNKAIDTIKDQHASALQKGVAVGQAGIGAINAIFEIITAPLAAASTVPGVGNLADLVNGVFSAVGSGGKFATDRALDALPISDNARETIRPLADEVGALAAQIVAGKVGGDAIGKLGDKTKDLATTISQNLPKPTIESQRGFINPHAVSGDIIEKVNTAKDYIAKSNEMTVRSNNLGKDLNTLTQARKADDIRGRQFLERANISPKDAETLYHYSEDKSVKLTDVQKEMYDKYIKPLQDARQTLFEKIRNEGVPVENENYTPRFVADKGGFYERLVAGAKSAASKAGLLTKSTGAFKHRVMKVIEDEQGNRSVVSVKDGRITKYENGKATDMGPVALKSNEDLMNKEIAPVQAKLNRLQTEQRTLSATKGRSTSAARRLQTIQRQIIQHTNKIAEIEGRYKSEALDNKIFIGKDGTRYRIKDATTKEIEANTNLRYHKNVLLNELISYNKLKQIDRAITFLNQFKNAPDFEKIGMKLGTKNIPDGWKTTSLPQFRGYAFDPKIADTLDHFAGRLASGEDAGKILESVNHFLRTSIFFNPLIHIPNITVHWLVNRGALSWLKPSAYGRLMRTGGRAIRAVATLNQDYVRMLDHGVNLQYADTTGRLSDLMVKKIGEELQSPENKDILADITKSIGMAPAKLVKAIYDFSGKATWSVNDVATMQAIYEEMENGSSFEHAIDEVGKHIPNYVVPARVLNSRFISKVMTNSNVTMFGGYHYGMWKSYGELVKSTLGKVPRSERGAALDKLAMLGFITLVVYPQLDQLAKAITGRNTATFRRAGATTGIYNLAQLATGKLSMAHFLQSVMTPAPLFKAGVETMTGRDLYSGNQLSSETPLQYVGNAISPIQQGTKIFSGKQTVGQFAASLLGIKTSANTPSVMNLQDLIYNQRNQVSAKVKDMYLTGKQDDANDLIVQFDTELLNNAVDAYREAGYNVSDEKALRQWLISTGLKQYLLKVPTEKQLVGRQATQGKKGLEKIIK